MYCSLSWVSVCVAQRKEVRHLICTDVAARGIDIHGVPYGKRWKTMEYPDIGGDVTDFINRWPCLIMSKSGSTLGCLSQCVAHFTSPSPPVINVTLPDEKQNYVHRIGRVGRAER